MIKTIVCYGDSNTYGLAPMASPTSNTRFGIGERWPSVLQQALGSQVSVIEEGLSARTTVHDDPIEGRHKNGLNYLLPCLESHQPMDVFILMLGTNDLKSRFHVQPADIAYSIDTLLQVVLSCGCGPQGQSPVVLLISPVPIQEIGFLGEIFAGGSEKSHHLAKKFQDIAQTRNLLFLDAGRFATCSPIDGIHFSIEHHQALGQAIADLLREHQVV